MKNDDEKKTITDKKDKRENLSKVVELMNKGYSRRLAMAMIEGLKTNPPEALKKSKK